MEKVNFIYKITPKKENFIQTMSDEEGRVMAEHFAYLKKLLAEKKLVLAGPCSDAAFGIAILENVSREEAEKIMLDDPAVARGVMNCELHQYRISLAKENFSSQAE